MPRASKIETEARKPRGKLVNDWSIVIDRMGRYGTDYLFRSVDRAGRPGGKPARGCASIPSTRVDADGADTDRREPLRDPLRQGAAPAGGSLLVGDNVQLEAVLSSITRSTATRSATATS